MQQLANYALGELWGTCSSKVKLAGATRERGIAQQRNCFTAL